MDAYHTRKPWRRALTGLTGAGLPPGTETRTGIAAVAKIRLPDLRAGEAEPEIVVAVARGVVVAIGTAQVARGVVPTATPFHSVGAAGNGKPPHRLARTQSQDQACMIGRPTMTKPPPNRIAARLDAESVAHLDRLMEQTGERNTTTLLKLALARAVNGCDVPTQADHAAIQANTDTGTGTGTGTGNEPDPGNRAGAARDAKAVSETSASAETKTSAVENQRIPPAPRATPSASETGEAMQVRVVTLAFDPARGCFDDEPLRLLLAGRQITRLDKQFFQQDGRSYWSAWVEYRPEPSLAERREPTHRLTGEPLRLFEALREWRRDTAEALGVPAYAVATNRQLLAVVDARPASRAALGRLSGFGKKKLAQHGDAIIRLVADFARQAQAG